MSNPERPCLFTFDPSCEHILDRHALTPCLRDDSYGQGLIDLEPGVRLFVRGIEALGGVTHWSCEGHPNGFYVLFSAAYEAAVALKTLGFFRVEVEGMHRFSIRLPDLSIGNSPDRALEILRMAGAAWARAIPGLSDCSHPDFNAATAVPRPDQKS